jgi:hypothetical protein
MPYFIDQYSFLSMPQFWNLPSSVSPLPPLPPWPFPWIHIQVLYTEARLPAGVDPNPEILIPAPTLSYQDGTHAESFSGDQITDETTVLGRLLTVTVVQTVDRGDTLFSLILPTVNEQGAGTAVALSTVGITSRSVGQTVPKSPQALVYSHMGFSGTFSTRQLPPGSE